MTTTAKLQKKALKRARWEALPPYHKFCWIVTYITVAVILLAIGGTGPGRVDPNGVTMVVFGFMIVAWLVWMPVLWMYISRQTDAVFASAHAASQPIPSPAQIYDSLLAEWDREPTIVEVSAVQQMLHNQKNMALVQAGLGFGALYLLSKHH
jgi:hypothetical protein